jgi:phosphoribosylformimino-5-aminoimidazole carboxamide ribonucleotide (ProFAR) isomerase
VRVSCVTHRLGDAGLGGVDEAEEAEEGVAVGGQRVLQGLVTVVRLGREVRLCVPHSHTQRRLSLRLRLRRAQVNGWWLTSGSVFLANPRTRSPVLASSR